MAKQRKSKFSIHGGRTHYKGIPADVVGLELERINRENDGIEASMVVSESRPDDAPLHPVFEWDDYKAAEEYRVMQARTIIRVVLKVEDVDGANRMSRQYVHIPRQSDADNSSREGTYRPIRVVVETPDLYAIALGSLHSKLRSAASAVEELKNAAKSSKSVGNGEMAKIEIAVQAMQMATAAVASLH